MPMPGVHQAMKLSLCFANCSLSPTARIPAVTHVLFIFVAALNLVFGVMHHFKKRNTKNDTVGEHENAGELASRSVGRIRE